MSLNYFLALFFPLTARVLFCATLHPTFPPFLPSLAPLPPSLPFPHLMATHGPHAFMMRGHVPHHEVGIIRASHAHVAIVRKRHGVNTAKMPSEAAVESESLQCARSGANAATHCLVRDARTLLPPEEQVKGEGVVVMMVLV